MAAVHRAPRAAASRVPAAACRKVTTADYPARLASTHFRRGAGGKIMPKKRTDWGWGRIKGSYGKTYHDGVDHTCSQANPAARPGPDPATPKTPKSATLRKTVPGEDGATDWQRPWVLMRHF